MDQASADLLERSNLMLAVSEVGGEGGEVNATNAAPDDTDTDGTGGQHTATGSGQTTGQQMLQSRPACKLK